MHGNRLVKLSKKSVLCVLNVRIVRTLVLVFSRNNGGKHAIVHKSVKNEANKANHVRSIIPRVTHSREMR